MNPEQLNVYNLFAGPDSRWKVFHRWCQSSSESFKSTSEHLAKKC